MHTEIFTEDPDQDLVAFPAAGDPEDWATRVPCIVTGTGRYSVTVDPLISRDWLIFIDSEDLTDFSEAILSFDIPQLSTPTGTGARTVTLTVTDGTIPLASAMVRLTAGVNTYIGTTDLEGEIVFNIDDGTWAVSATKGGYSFAGSTAVVTGDRSIAIVMEATAFTPPTIANTCAVVVPAIRSSTPVVGADVSAILPDRFSDLPAGVQMVAVDSAITNSEGIAVLYLPWSSLYVHGDGTYRIRVRDPITQEIVYDRFVVVPNLSTARIDQLLDFTN